MAQPQQRVKRAVDANQPRLKAAVARTCSGQLAPDDRQRRALDAVFIAPEYVLYLLLKEQPVIEDLTQARIFLLSHKKDIEGYLPVAQREALIDILADFLVAWSKALPASIDLNFGEMRVYTTGKRRFISDSNLGSIQLKRGGGEWPGPKQVVRTVVKKDGENYWAVCSYQNQRAEEKKNMTRERTGRVKRPGAMKGDDTGLLWPRGPVLCPLCGERVYHGISAHKREVHGEGPDGSTHGPNRPRTWVQLFQGGAPGLGKGKS